MKYCANARRTAKSRKGKYFGKQNQQAADVLVDATAISSENSVVDDGEAALVIGENNLPSTPHFDQVPKGDGTGLKVFKTLTKRSEEKLRNSCFSMLDPPPPPPPPPPHTHIKRKKTRSVTTQLGLSKQKCPSFDLEQDCGFFPTTSRFGIFFWLVESIKDKTVCPGAEGGGGGSCVQSCVP